MKSKNILLVTLLLTQTSAVWAMREDDEPRARGVHQQRRANQDIDFDTLQQSINEISVQIPDANPQAMPQRVIVLGPTGSGKTSLIHGLANVPLIPEEGARGRELRPQYNLPGFNVVHGVRVGTTIPRFHAIDNVEFWDSPGFGDPRGAEKDIVNAFAIDKLFKNSSVKVLLAVPEGYLLNDRGTPFLNLLNEMTELLPDRNQLERCLSIVITKHERTRPHLLLPEILRDAEILNPAARNLLEFLAAHPTRITTFGYPNHQADYHMPRGGILGCIGTADFTPNPNVALRVGGQSRLLIDRLATNLNNSITNYVRETYIPNIRNYSQSLENMGLQDQGIEQYVTNLQQVDLNNPQALAEGLAMFGNAEPIRQKIRAIDFLRRVRGGITHRVQEWIAPLQELPEILNAGISTYVRETSIPQIYEYCQREIDNHANTVGTLRNNFAMLEQNIRGIQQTPADNPQAIIDGLVRFGNVTPMKRSLNAINFLRKIGIRSNPNTAAWTNPLVQSTQQIHELTLPPFRENAGGILSLRGALIGTSDIPASNTPICISAWNTIFGDQNLTNHGQDLYMFTPQFKICQRISINLSGLPGGPGGDGNVAGAHGNPGRAGKRGGNFYCHFDSAQNLPLLTIDTSGGNGGNGGNGAQGTTGNDGVSGSESLLTNRINVVHISSTDFHGERPTGDFNVATLNRTGNAHCASMNGTKTVYTHGSNGTPGGGGGNAGAGGYAGPEGTARLEPASVGWTHIANPGHNGNPGRVGAGGIGGLNGPILQGVYITNMHGTYAHTHPCFMGSRTDHLPCNKEDHWLSITTVSPQFRAAGPRGIGINAHGRQPQEVQRSANDLTRERTQLTEGFRARYNEQAENPFRKEFLHR